METSFSSVVTPSPQNNVVKRFEEVASNIEKGGRGGYLIFMVVPVILIEGALLSINIVNGG